MKKCDFILIVLCGLFAGACAHSERAMDIAALDGDLSNGRVLYQEYCASCHGENGDDGSGPSLLRRSNIEMSVEENADEIIERMEEKGRRADRVYLSDQEIADIIAYVRELQGQ